MKLKGDPQIDISALFKELESPTRLGGSQQFPYDLKGVDINLGGLRKELGLPELQGGRSGWDETFSDPRDHQKHSFRYLLHGIQDADIRLLQHAALLNLPGNFDTTQHIDLCETPGRVREKKLISASVIDQQHLGTFGGAGLILSCPVENVIDISHEDFGTNYANPDAVLKNRGKSLPTLDGVLQRTGKGSTDWNEVRLTGTTDAGEVTVVGYWIKFDERGIPKSPEVAERMRCLAAANAFPLITFVIESEPMIDQSPEIHYSLEAGGKRRPWAVSVNKDGLRYFIDLDTGEAIVVNRYRESRAMTSAEAITFNEELIEKMNPEKYRAIGDRLASAIMKTH